MQSGKRAWLQRIGFGTLPRTHPKKHLGKGLVNNLRKLVG